MKRVTVMTTLVALALVLVVGGTASAQGQSQGGTRVAVVNIYNIMKNYKKVEMLNESLKQDMAPLEKKMKDAQEQFTAWKKIFEDPKTASKKKEEAQKNMVAYKRYMEDLVLERNKMLMKRGEEQAVQVYREIEDAIKRFSLTNGIHIVFQYYEPLEEDDRYSPRNIRRKLHECSNVGASAPIYIANGIDVSQHVLAILNSQFPPNKKGN